MASVIRFACGTCHEKLSVPARYAGRKGVCPSCRAVNRVPTASESPAPAAVAAAVPPAPLAAPPQREVGRAVQHPVSPPRDAGWDIVPPPPAAPRRDPGWDPVPPAPADPVWSPPRAAPVRESVAAPSPASPAPAAPSPAIEMPARVSPSSSAATAGVWPEDQPARTFSLFGWLRRSVGEADAPLRREWEVDRGGLPLPAKLSLLVLAALAFVATLWGVIYGLLRLLVGGDE